MIELELVGIHADGENLVLLDGEGSRYQVTIDDALRAAVRRDRPQLEQLRSTTMRPREIQVLVRAGATAEEVAEQGGATIDQVRRYEGPVLAERAHVAGRAQALLVGREAGASTLGDLVVDRLAARGVTDLAWDSRRQGSDPWQVVLTYVAEETTQQALWQVDLAARSFRALDEHARLLSEADLAEPGPRRHLSAVPRAYNIENDGDISPALQAINHDLRHGHPDEMEPADEPGSDDTEAILAELAATRGVRQRLEEPEHDELPLWEEPSSEATGKVAAREPNGEAPSGDVVDLPQREQEPEPEPAPTRRRGRSRRTSVPSWDEIVFGAKND